VYDAQRDRTDVLATEESSFAVFFQCTQEWDSSARARDSSAGPPPTPSTSCGGAPPLPPPWERSPSTSRPNSRSRPGSQGGGHGAHAAVAWGDHTHRMVRRPARVCIRMRRAMRMQCTPHRTVRLCSCARRLGCLRLQPLTLRSQPPCFVSWLGTAFHPPCDACAFRSPHACKPARRTQP